MPSKTNRKIRILGVLWAVYGMACVVKVAWLAIEAPVLALMWGALLNRVPGPFAWMSFFHFMLLVAIAEFVLTAAFSLLAAAAILATSPSGRNRALTAAFA